MATQFARNPLVCLIAIVCTSLLAAGGCGRKPPVNSDEAKTRVETAAQIGNPTERDSALAQACRDAAQIGAGDVVASGALKIGNPTLRDEVAADCALKLRDAGQAAAAGNVVKLIGNPSTRDEILKKLASGS